MRSATRISSAVATALITVGALAPVAQAAESTPPDAAPEQATAPAAQPDAPAAQPAAPAAQPADPAAVARAAADSAVAEADAALAGAYSAAQRLHDDARQAGRDVIDHADRAARQAAAAQADAQAQVSELGHRLAGQADLPAAPFAAVQVDPTADGPNYHWSNEPVDQILAGKLPGSGPVLHRAPDSRFDADPVPPATVEAAGRGMALMGSGTPVYVGDDALCTLTAVGTDAQGRKIGLTAAHCGTVGEPVFSADAPGVGPAGTVVAADPDADVSVVELGSNAELTDAYYGTPVTGFGEPTGPGATLCKQGVATGYTCGVTWASQPGYTVAQLCAGAGDSGAPVIVDGRVVGSVTGGVLPLKFLACNSPLQGPLHMPTLISPVGPTVAKLQGMPAGAPGNGFEIYRR